MAPPSGEAPLYQRIARTLREQIASGTLAPGDVLPTEVTLAEEYGVTRSTVRQALNLLYNEGLITAGRGRSGRHVRSITRVRVDASNNEKLSRVEEHQSSGIDVFTGSVQAVGGEAAQAITTGTVRAPANVAEALGIETGTPVVLRRRLRTVDGQPHSTAATYYPMDIAGGTAIALPDDIPQGVTALMKEMGYVQVRYVDLLSWRPPTPEEADELDIPGGVSVLIKSRTGYTPDDRPVRVTVTTWPGDRTELSYEIEA